MFTAGKSRLLPDFNSANFAAGVHRNGEHVMPQSPDHSTQLVLIDHAGLGRIHVDMEAFFEFSFWLAEELEDLVAKWSHTAAPNTKRQWKNGALDRH